MAASHFRGEVILTVKDSKVFIRPDLEDMLRRSPKVQRALRKATRNGITHARSLVNVLSGQYNASFIERTLPDGSWQIVNTSGHADFLEFGTRRMAAQHVLGRTAAWLEGGPSTVGTPTPSWTHGVPNGLTTVEARALRRYYGRRP